MSELSKLNVLKLTLELFLTLIIIMRKRGD